MGNIKRAAPMTLVYNGELRKQANGRAHQAKQKRRRAVAGRRYAAAGKRWL
jgi:hypothetical protein